MRASFNTVICRRFQRKVLVVDDGALLLQLEEIGVYCLKLAGIKGSNRQSERVRTKSGGL